MVAWFRALLHEDVAYGNRNNALAPVAWVLALLIGAIPAVILLGTPEKFVWAVFILAAATLAILLASYVFFVFTNPDALRSESYVLKKTMIERGMIGDDLVGLVSSREVLDQPRLPSSDDDENDQDART